MTTRDRLRAAYELAFFPPRADQLWRRIKNKDAEDKEELMGLLEMALTLHRALPLRGYGSMRALKRLAYYQACSRAFGTVNYLHNLYRHLSGGKDPDLPDDIPGDWVRDIALPEFNHHNSS